MKEIQDFLKDCGVFYIATQEGNQPRVRPFGVIEIFENKLYIQTGKVKNCYKEIIDNPFVEVSAFYEGKWIRLSGKLVSDDRIEAKKSMLDKYPDLRGMYNELDDNTIVLYFKDATATIYSFMEAPVTFKF